VHKFFDNSRLYNLMLLIENKKKEYIVIPYFIYEIVNKNIKACWNFWAVMYIIRICCVQHITHKKKSHEEINNYN